MQNDMQEAYQAIAKRWPNTASNDTKTLAEYGFDGLKIAFSPDAVFKPDQEMQVEGILKEANRAKIPVTVRGAGSTLTGSATPRRGGWVVDLSLFDSIEINQTEKFARVGAGAIVQQIQNKALAVGLFYPPDPSSFRWCTIGGNIACNAGGLRCVKYGVTRDYVLSLRGFLPTGEPVEWGTHTRKFATGYNIRDLWVGSEGTLGVITSAVIKLIPQPETRQSLLCAFESETAALHSILRLLETNICPSVIEFIDRLSVKGAEKSHGKPFFEGMDSPCVVLMELDGTKAEVTRDLHRIETWATQFAAGIKIATSEAETEEIWAARRKCSKAMFELGNTKLNEDIVVPLPKMPELVEWISDLRILYSLPIAVFGHAGDGNLHVNIMYDSLDAEQTKCAESCLDKLMRKVVELGGAISGEHGIGLAKANYIALQFSAVQLGVMKAIKALLDPNDILNPGKLFEPFSPWEHKKVVHEFPWDKK